MMADKNNPPFIKFDRTFVDALAHRIVGRGMSHRVVVRADKWTVEPSNSCAGKQTLHILLYPAQQAGSIGKITQSDESVRQILCVQLDSIAHVGLKSYGIMGCAWAIATILLLGCVA